MWNRILSNIMGLSSRGRDSKGSVPNKNGSVWVPKVNGKHSKHVQNVSLKIEGESVPQGVSIARIMQANIPMHEEVLPGLQSWQASKIASWHNIEGHSILWFCVVSLDRRGNSFSFFQLIMVAISLILAVRLSYLWHIGAS